MEELTFDSVPNVNTNQLTPDPTYSPVTSFEQPSLSTIGNNQGFSLPTDMFKSASDDLVNLAKSKPSLAANMRPVEFDYEAVNPTRYKNAALFNQYGLDLTGNNNEEIYGSLQTTWSKLGNMVLGAGNLAYHQFKDQATSWDDTFDILTKNPIFKQQELEEISKRQKELFDNNPIFQTKEDRETFFNMSNFALMGQQSGYMLGAAAEMWVENTVLTALTSATFGALGGLQVVRNITLLNKVGKAVNNSLKAVEAIQEASKLRTAFNSALKYVIPVENVLEYGKNFGKIAAVDRSVYGVGLGAARTAARGFGAFYRDARIVNAAIAEASAEAATTNDEILKSLKDDYYNKTGKLAQGAVLDDLKNKSYEAAKTNGLANIALIMLTDKIALDGVLKSFKPMRFLEDGISSKGLYLNTKKAIAAGEEALVEKTGIIKPLIHKLKTAPLQTLTKDAINYTKSNLIEGVQEVGQNISSGTVKNWYEYKYGLGEERDRVNSVREALYKSAKDQWSMEGSKTFFSGFLTGSIMNGITYGFSKTSDTYSKFKNPTEFADKEAAVKKERDEIKNTFNTFYKDPTSYIILTPKLSAGMTEAAKRGDKKEVLDLKGDLTRQFIINSVKSGTIDLVVDRFNDFTTNLTTEEFKQAFNTSILDNLTDEQAKSKIREISQEFKSKVNSIKTTYDNLTNIYPNEYNPGKYKAGTDEYAEEWLNFRVHNEAIEQIAFAKDMYADIGIRQADVLKSISGKVPGLPFSMLTNLTSRTKNLNKEINLLKQELEVATDKSVIMRLETKIKFLSQYSESLKELPNQLVNSKDTQQVKKDFISKNKAVISKLINAELEDSNQQRLNEEQLNDILIDVVDYLELNEDNSTALEYFNILANPDKFSNLLEAHKIELTKIIKENAQSQSTNNQPTDGTQNPVGETTGTNQAGTQNQDTKLVVTLTDDDGIPKDFTLEVNKEYITKATPSQKEINGKLVKIYNQDYFKVVGISGNDITISQTNDVKVTLTKEEFENIFTGLYDITDKPDNIKIYFKYRDYALSFAVNIKTGKLHKLNDTTYDKTKKVNGRLEGVKENGKFKLFIKYVNPFTNEVETVPYSREYFAKYGLEKTDLRGLSKEDKQNLIAKNTAEKDLELRSQNEILIKNKIDNLKNEINRLKSETSSIYDSIDLLNKLLDNNVESSINEINLIEEQLNTLEKIIKTNSSKNTKRGQNTLEKINILKNQIKNEFKLANNLTDNIRSLKKHIVQNEQILKDLNNQINYYFNLLNNQNIKTLNVQDLQNEIKKINKKKSVIEKLINILKTTLSKTIFYLKEYVTIANKRVSEYESLKSKNNFKILSDLELKQLIKSDNLEDNIKADKYSDLKNEIKNLELASLNAISDVDIFEKAQESEEYRLNILLNKVQNYNNQIRYIEELLPEINKDIKENPLKNLNVGLNKPLESKKQTEIQDKSINKIVNIQPTTLNAVLQPTEKGSPDDLMGKGRTEPIITSTESIIEQKKDDIEKTLYGTLSGNIPLSQALPNGVYIDLDNGLFAYADKNEEIAAIVDKNNGYIVSKSFWDANTNKWQLPIKANLKDDANKLNVNETIYIQKYQAAVNVLNAKYDELTLEKTNNTQTDSNQNIESKIQEVLSNKDFIKLSDDGKYYINTNTGKQYQRVTSYISDDKVSLLPLKPNETIDDYKKRLESSELTNAQKASELLLATSSILGTKIDKLVRDFFSNKLKDIKSYGIGDVKLVESFIKELEVIKQNFNSRGETVISEDIVLYNDELGVAGTIDLLTYDKQGNVRIYDMKTMRGDNFVDNGYGNKFDSTAVFELTGFLKSSGEPSYKIVSGATQDSKRTKYTKQLSLYRILLNNTHGILARTIGIMPIEVMYTIGNPTTNVLNILEGVKLIPTDNVKTTATKPSIEEEIVEPLNEPFDTGEVSFETDGEVLNMEEFFDVGELEEVESRGENLFTTEFKEKIANADITELEIIKKDLQDSILLGRIDAEDALLLNKLIDNKPNKLSNFDSVSVDDFITIEGTVYRIVRKSAKTITIESKLSGKKNRKPIEEFNKANINIITKNNSILNTGTTSDINITEEVVSVFEDSKVLLENKIKNSDFMKNKEKTIIGTPDKDMVNFINDFLNNLGCKS